MLRYRNFISKFNSINGKMEWQSFESSYDFKSEIRASGYADMLNDTDRNLKYYNALKEVINTMKSKNLKTHVLDIGCGSGILSMMALKLGADKVTACESFKPMYKCAKNVLKKNNLFSDKIDIINCNSSDLVIGVNMSEKANILVSEIFDTELIGEGVLPTFHYALCHLLTDNPMVIPFKAKVYVALLENDFLHLHSWLNESKYFSRLPASYYTCHGYPFPFDIQASSLVNFVEQRICASKPIMVKEIDFSQSISLINSESISCNIPYIFSQNTSKDFACVMWWELMMVENEPDCKISTVPKWALNLDNDEYHWRDHWLQAVFSIRNCNIEYETSSNINFNINHDNYSFWINIKEKNEGSAKGRSFCTCGLHVHVPHNRLYQLNSIEYSIQIDNITKFAMSRNIKNAMVISTFSYLPISLGRVGITTIAVVEKELKNTLQELVDLNSHDVINPIKLTCLDDLIIDDVNTVDLIVGDPFFLHALFPWDHVHFWYVADQVKKKTENVISWTLPRKMCIKGMLVKFEHLHKVNKPVRVIYGFDMSPFDDLVHDDPQNERIYFDPRFLWEYDCYSRSEIGVVMMVDMTQSVENLILHSGSDLVGNHVFRDVDWLDTNGLVLWIAWELWEDVWFDTSLDSINCSTGKVTWKPFTKQAVHFLDDSKLKNCQRFQLQCIFDVKMADFHFSIFL